MKILNYLIVALCFLMINASSCFDKDDEDKLPPETLTGNNTFGCLVNEKIWIPSGFSFPEPNLDIVINKNQLTYMALKIK
ncbi:MAG: hypothetical protein AB7S48_01970 [Bacteroidales bacterium]